MGIKFTRKGAQANGTVGSGGSTPSDDMELEDEEEERVNRIYRALYAFSGSNEDEVHLCVHRLCIYICFS